MIPFINNPYGIFGLPMLGLSPFFSPVARNRSCVKQLQTFELPTNGVSLSATSVDYGINPNIYRRLPYECLIMLRIRQAVPAGGEGLPITVVTPTNSSSSTVSTPGGTAGTKKTPVVDHKNTQVVGNDVSEFTDALALLDKKLGIIRFVNFISAGAPAQEQSNADTQVPVDVKNK